ncbi:MAG: hypothetical protein JNM17_29725 [Archangium sp.]|nr:hypothetical protein [Archangium sp.]
MTKSHVALVVIAMSACTGPAGPAGPAGAAGAMGAPGAMGNPGTGIAGIDGMNGQSVTVTALPVGSAMCPAGGAQLVGADGGSAVICSAASNETEPIYGHGDAGTLTISVDTDWQMNPPTSYEFTDVTIAAGATLTVPSGVTILATGTFTNLGTIEVQGWANGGYISFQDEPLPDGGAGPLINVSVSEPGQGVALRPARNGVVTRGTQGPFSMGGFKLSVAAARRLIRIAEETGGGGGGSADITGLRNGGYGGGAFSLRAAGVVQAGAIHANGEAGVPCAGGGAGGVIVVVSGTSISIGATTARGGNGGSNAGDIPCSGGGGGGGGIVHLIAPQIGPTTTVDVGFGFSTFYPFNPAPISSTSGGGGACGGHGGSGGALPNGYGGAGTPGLVLTSQTNPARLF